MIGPLVSRAAGRAGSWRRAVVVAVAAAVLAGVLAAGIALGMALNDNPRPTGPLTVERTVVPAP